MLTRVWCQVCWAIGERCGGGTAALTLIQSPNYAGGRAQWTNTGLDPRISKFSGQEWTGTDEEGGMVRNAPKIKSRESSGKKKKKKKNKKKQKKSLDKKKLKIKKNY